MTKRFTTPTSSPCPSPPSVSLCSVSRPRPAAPDIDVLASAALGDELGGQPVALALFDDGTVVLVGADERGGTLVRLDAAGVAEGCGRHGSRARVDDVAVDRRTGLRRARRATSRSPCSTPGSASSWRAPLAPRERRRACASRRRRRARHDRGRCGGRAAHVLRRWRRPRHDCAAGWHEHRLSPCSTAADLVVTTGWTRDRHATIGSTSPRSRASLARARRAGARRVTSRTDLATAPTARAASMSRVARTGSIYLLAEVEGRAANVFAAPRTNVGFDALTSDGRRRIVAVRVLRPLLARRRARARPVLRVPRRGCDRAAAAIAADEHGNVLVTGTTSHRLAPDDDGDPHRGALRSGGVLSGRPRRLSATRLWRSLEIDDTSTTSRRWRSRVRSVVTLLQTVALAECRRDAPAGPMVLVWPTDPKSPAGIPKRPDRDDVGTFGYESGVAGSDPTCYACGPTRAPHRSACSRSAWS